MLLLHDPAHAQVDFDEPLTRIIALVTFDAVGTQTKNAQANGDCGGGDLLAVKRNLAKPHDENRRHLDDPAAMRLATTSVGWPRPVTARAPWREIPSSRSATPHQTIAPF